jgi:spore coat polysaccharide biosynthesis protein SpsF (cytidylyltransferase family)
MTTVAIIQARMTSARFPGKPMYMLAGRPMVSHVIDSARASCVDQTVVATSVGRGDDRLCDYLDCMGVPFFRGSLNHPLDRMYDCAYEHSADTVVRITGDCPLVDYRLITQCVQLFGDAGVDYLGVTNSPDGTDVEVFTYDALQQAFEKAPRHQREHTTTWIRKTMSCISTESDPAYADIHYSVDTPDQLALCERLIAACGERAPWQSHVTAYRNLHVHSP